MRCFAGRIVVNILEVAFFTWGNAGRILHLPAVGVVLLLADLVLAAHARLKRRVSPRMALAATLPVISVLAARFGTFTYKGAARVAERTEPSRRCVEEIGARNPHPQRNGTVEVREATARPIPELSQEPAAQAAFCMDTLEVAIR